MSVELTAFEKASLLSGASVWESRAVPRAGIRSLILADGPHGVRRQVGSSDHLGINASSPATCFPTAVTIASAWNPALAEEIGEALGAEASNLGVDVLLGPGLNIKRSPLCGRNFEYFSEDPFLSGVLAAGYVRGIQSQGVAACPKHFAVNSQEHRRMTSDSVVDERTLREIYLTGFEKVVRESAPRTIMSSYNLVDGVFASESHHLLQDILRDEWGFEGAVVTDWGGGNDPVAAALAGGTLEMPSPGFDSVRQILAAIEDGRIKESDLDPRVAEILALGEWADRREAKPVDHDAHHALARRAAAGGHVLLRNEQSVLPLSPGTRVAVIGDFATTPRYQGAGSSLVNPTQLSIPSEALAASGLEIVASAQGFQRSGVADDALRDEAVRAAQGVDVVLLFLGLDEVSESEGRDRTHMRLPDNQVALLQALDASGATVVVVLAAGSPVEMPWLECTQALLHGFLGGQAGAEATVDVLTGRVNPSGRLAETYPVRLEDTPAHRWYGRDDVLEYREGLFVGYRYYSTAGVPVLFPFGFGLSYTTFEYSDLSVTEGGATFTVRNTGARTGAEVAQVYVARESEGVHRAARELKGFARVELAPGASRTVTVPLDDRAFAHYSTELGDWAVERGTYSVHVGSNVADTALQATLDVDGIEPASDAARLPSYAAATITDVSDAEFETLLGRPLTVPVQAKVLGINDPLLAMSRARSPLARLAAWVLRTLEARAERRGNPDLNLFFLQNMPLRAIAKMTNGSVSTPMVEAILRIVNGKHLRGIGALVAAAVQNFRSTRAMRRALEAGRDPR